MSEQNPSTPVDPVVDASAAAPAVVPAADAPPARSEPAAQPAEALAAPTGQEPPAPEAKAEPESEDEAPDEAYFDSMIQAADYAVGEAKLAVKAAQERVAAAQKKYDAAVEAKAKAFPPLTPAQTIAAHIKREAERRAARVGAANMVNDAAGAKIASGRSPLDQSIAGRRKPQPMVPQHTTPTE